MSTKQTPNFQSKFVHLENTASDFSNSKYESFHLERDGNGIKIVSDGVSDRQKEIESHVHEAGLVNILKMQELRYGTIDNAIVRNKENQVYADVSVIPTSVAEQATYVAETRAAIQALCAKLGISPEELLTKDESSIASLLTPEQSSSAPEGGNE